jgi:CheY-like chemotaxis protein
MDEKTILLVDDEQAFLEPLEDALLHLRHRVRKATTVTAALEKLQAERIHLVTIDIMLPAGGDLDQSVSSQTAGLHLCQEMRRRFPQIPAICMSVVTDKETIRKVRGLGFSFLRKGEVPLRTVLETIEAELKKADANQKRRGGKGQLRGW